jgi:hypothetical protein
MLLSDVLCLPGFSDEVNWQSSLRNRSGFTTRKDGKSDFMCEGVNGELTRYFKGIQHTYYTPAWPTTVRNDGNIPTYRLEVKGTASKDL